MKPQLMDNLVSCPKCGRLDNVSMCSGSMGILWCACGYVFVVGSAPDTNILDGALTSIHPILKIGDDTQYVR